MYVIDFQDPPPDGKCDEGTGTQGAGTSSILQGMDGGVSYGNPIKAPISFRSSIFNTFITKEIANVGTYWIPGISDNLTVNDVVDYDAGFAPDFPLHDKESPFGHTFPFSRESNQEQYSLPDAESLDCYYEDILNNQYTLCYGSEVYQSHCI